ncbi:MAG: hypothetical protein ACREIM_01145 [Nitrospiraceae bacterium]
MKTQRILSSLSVAVVTFGVLSLLAFGIGRADTAWVDELRNSLHFYQINYPTSNWEPYSHKLDVVKQAVAGGDQRTVKSEMGKWFKMLRSRDHGINEVAADELFNFALMVTPIQAYGISVPTTGPATETGY